MGHTNEREITILDQDKYYISLKVYYLHWVCSWPCYPSNSWVSDRIRRPNIWTHMKGFWISSKPQTSPPIVVGLRLLETAENVAVERSVADPPYCNRRSQPQYCEFQLYQWPRTHCLNSELDLDIVLQVDDSTVFGDQVYAGKSSRNSSHSISVAPHMVTLTGREPKKKSMRMECRWNLTWLVTIQVAHTSSRSPQLLQSYSPRLVSQIAQLPVAHWPRPSCPVKTGAGEHHWWVP